MGEAKEVYYKVGKYTFLEPSANLPQITKSSNFNGFQQRVIANQAQENSAYTNERVSKRTLTSETEQPIQPKKGRVQQQADFPDQGNDTDFNQTRLENVNRTSDVGQACPWTEPSKRNDQFGQSHLKKDQPKKQHANSTQANKDPILIVEQGKRKEENQLVQFTNIDDMHGKFVSFMKDNVKQYNDDWHLEKKLREKMYETLHNTFQIQDFRHCQLSIIIASLSNCDCFVLMPTGAGKSLCYQLTAMLSDGLTIVISPLRSLMTDQVSKLKALNIPCECLRGDLSDSERNDIHKQLDSQDLALKLLYVSPEMLITSGSLETRLKRLHSQGKISRIAIDEAHCISSWGHNFRPEYGKLGKYFEKFQHPRVPIMALTATATPKTFIDTQANLNIKSSKLFISSFVRSNLIYGVIPKSASEFNKVLKQMKKKYPNGSGIVYCLTQKDCHNVSKIVNSMRIPSEPYHAGLSDDVREATQQKWMTDKIKVVCATIAFGMGIDKKDVRFVLHHTMSQSIEAYYQETGRAGRDGLISSCILFYTFKDYERIFGLFRYDEYSSDVQKAFKVQKLLQVIQYCENSTTCRRKLLVEHFGEFYDFVYCRNGDTPCSICESFREKKSDCKAYDLTSEAVIILQYVSPTKHVTLDKLVGDYCKKNVKFVQNQKSSMLGRGCDLSEDDVRRLLHKLLVDGYLTSKCGSNSDVLLIISDFGEEFIKKQQWKFFSYLSNLPNRSHFSKLKAVSDVTVLKEARKMKSPKIFAEAQIEFQKLFDSIAAEEGRPNSSSILSAEGIEQLAVLLPRTKSDILQVDSMTAEVLEVYGPRIVSILRQFWSKLDEEESEKIKELANSA